MNDLQLKDSIVAKGDSFYNKKNKKSYTK